ncbi:thioredoxin domain-containing protein [Haloplanus halobius]|uniref:thioredoxin domain-containing protein n=1 Tax=Haloplanus halobius TaxID=2934938 RepID=UPI00200F1573|nr:thioredoxin domain-containing protein [Haloplanus sp. XH21]
MTAPTQRNRLDEEASPYLEQHADNPVNWQPWDETALETAREHDVPIFLSVGYAACHWCHVMEDESFQDEEVAAVLNERFVPIKVDREERPDVDSVYQTICQLVSGGGGWPLSVFLTPEGKPFYVGTYFPREPQRGRPGFMQLLKDISNSWNEDREEIENRADQWTAAIRDELESTPDQPGGPPESDVLGSATAAAIRSADRTHGGFGSGGPKFPQPRRLELLLRAATLDGDEAAGEVAGEALDAMATGGLYDHVGGGFHRYATDREWTVPHFEKMLYDNAELPRVYLEAAQAAGDDRYARIAQETIAFLERELQHPDGGFFSTLDAQSKPPVSRRDGDEGGSEDAEGAFYVWTPEEVDDAVAGDSIDGVDSETAADLFCDRYGVESGGNFEGGTTVLTVSESYEDLAEAYDLSVETVARVLMTARTRAFDARSERPRPARDEKVLAGWNGLAISAVAAGARVLDPALAETATDALGFVREHLWDEDAQRLSRRYKGGDIQVDGYLDDYAFLAQGAFDCYQVTGEVEHLAFAVDLARVIRAEFWDAEAGTLYYTPESGEGLVTRPQELNDQSTPSSLGAAASLFDDLDLFLPNEDFGSITETLLSTHADRIRSSPLEHASLVLAADAHTRGPVELTLAADEIPESWWETLAETPLPAGVVAPRPAAEADLDSWLDALGIDEVPPIWANREAQNGEPTAYACRSFTCSPPQTDLDAALSWLSENDRSA